MIDKYILTDLNMKQTSIPGSKGKTTQICPAGHMKVVLNSKMMLQQQQQQLAGRTSFPHAEQNVSKMPNNDQVQMLSVAQDCIQVRGFASCQVLKYYT